MVFLKETQSEKCLLLWKKGSEYWTGKNRGSLRQKNKVKKGVLNGLGN